MNLLVQTGQLNWVKLKSIELNDTSQFTNISAQLALLGTSVHVETNVEVIFPARLSHKLTLKQSVFLLSMFGKLKANSKDLMQIMFHPRLL